MLRVNGKSVQKNCQKEHRIRTIDVNSKLFVVQFNPMKNRWDFQRQKWGARICCTVGTVGCLHNKLHGKILMGNIPGKRLGFLCSRMHFWVGIPIAVVAVTAEVSRKIIQMHSPATPPPLLPLDHFMFINLQGVWSLGRRMMGIANAKSATSLHIEAKLNMQWKWCLA